MSLDANIGASVDLLGKHVSDLQENVVIADNALTGTLHYVEGYTGYSGDPDLQEGNYLALKVGGVPADAKVKVELLGGQSGESVLDADRIFIARIADTTQKIKVEAISGRNVLTQIYTLSGLTLEAKEGE